MSGPPLIFDRSAIARARTRAERSGKEQFLIQEAAEGIAARLAPIHRKFALAADLESRPAALDKLRPFAEDWAEVPISGQEIVEFGGRPFELMTSVLALQFANDLPGVLIQARRALAPDGVLAAALFGGDTLRELRESLAAAEIETLGGASPRVVPMSDIRELGQLLQRAGFNLPVADVDRTTVTYGNLVSLVNDLRANGQTNVLRERSMRPISRTVLRVAEEHYGKHFADSRGRLIATFDIVYLLGWSPSENQPSPLKPGSAKMPLASVLEPRVRK
jgi:SAM-dependent methyltransferase